MRSVYPAVFFCALACASAPSGSRLSSTGVQPASVSLPAGGSGSNARGHLLTGSFATEYFGGETLMDVLRRRVPLYLRPRANSSMEAAGRVDPVVVYINGSFSGNLDVLSSIPAREVFSVDRMGATDAMIKFGQRHSGGALLVTLVRHD
jgi:hypothetical protein